MEAELKPEVVWVVTRYIYPNARETLAIFPDKESALGLKESRSDCIVTTAPLFEDIEHFKDWHSANRT